MGENLGNLSQDLDIFGAPDGAVEDERIADVTVDDLFGPSDDVATEATETVEWEVTPEWEVKEEDTTKEVIKEETPKEETDKETDKGGEGTDDEVQKFIDDLLADNVEIEDKVQDIADKAEGEWDNGTLKMVDELQKLLAEKTNKIEEQAKQLEVSNNRFLEKVWEAENFSIHKDVIEKLESDSKLMMLVKHIDTDNDKVKDRLTWIVTDILYDLTWQDVTELMDSKVKDDVSAALWTPESNAPTTPSIKPEEEDVDLNFEDSINQLF